MKQLCKCLFLIPLIFLPSCRVNTQNVDISMLNYRYALVRCGDLHGKNPTSNEVLDRNEGFTSHINLFDKDLSYMNFECKGASVGDIKSYTTFYLTDKKGNIILNESGFTTTFKGSQLGTLVFSDQAVKERVGEVYVYTPYWCRWQCYYDVDGSGNKVLLTFEFWKRTYNPLPSFVETK